MNLVKMNLLSSIVLMAMACEGDVVVNKGANAAPTVLISSHGEGEVFESGQSVTFRATTNDDDHDASDLTMVWYIGATTVCEEAFLDENGMQECSVDVAEGMSSIVAEVRDPDGAAGRFELAFTVSTNEAPTVEIIDPAAASIFYSNEAITLQGVVSDLEDDPTQLQVEWRSNVDGLLSSASPDSVGATSASVYLSEGTHQVELFAQDGDGATAVDSVSLQIREANEAPTCDFVSPEDGDIIAVGEVIQFQAMVSDPNVSSDQLTVEWSSDKDGVFGTASAGSDGVSNLLYDGLSINTHVVTLRAEDERGLSCTTQRIVTVGTPPTALITSPQTGDVFNLGAAVSFNGTVSDSEDSPADLSIEWHSSLDGSLFTGVASSQGETVGTTTLSAGQHQITLHVTDTDGFASQASTVVYINTPPEAPTVSVSPNPVYTIDDVTVSISQPNDVDGDVVTHSVEWLQGMNQTVTGLTGLTLPASATSVSEYWTARVTPNDGHIDGPSTDVSFVIQNTAPSISNVVISPNPVFTGSTLTCSAMAMDPEEGLLQALYDWSVNGTPVGVGSTWTVSNVQASVGDSITCTATAQDSQMLSASASASVTLSNTNPVVSSVQISCASGAYNDQSCDCTASVSDPDEQVVPVFEWTDSSGVLSTAQTLDLSTTALMPGDVLECSVAAVDSAGGQSQGSDILSIANRPPNVPTVVISPVMPVAGIDDLNCQANTNGDPDGNAVNVLSHVWTSDFGNVSSGTLLPAGNVNDGETWTCQVVVSDGNMTATGFASVQAQSMNIDPVTFTTCGQTGHTGPDQIQCDGDYIGTDLENSVSVSNGVQQWIVPNTGTYTIEAYGAQGGYKGGAAGGAGAYVSGEFQFTAGEVLSLVVGQLGTSVTGTVQGGGGGGGSFVFDQLGNPLIIAGGGGGASYQGNAGYGGSSTTSSVGGGYGQSSGGGGGYTDNGGGGGTGAGGGGLYGTGTSNNWCNGGTANGGNGGASQYPGYGGFGGGGGSYHGGGGGGGYTGGSGGTYSIGGGGAGSYNAGSNPVSSPNANAGVGYIIISQ